MNAPWKVFAKNKVFAIMTHGQSGHQRQNQAKGIFGIPYSGDLNAF
jgi:hypothetical protein